MSLRSMSIVLVCAAAVLALPVADLHAQGYIKWSSLNSGLDLGSGKGVIAVSAGSGVAKPVFWAVVDGVGLSKSADGGKTWAKVAVADAKPSNVSASPVEGGPVFVATDKGLYVTTDGSAFSKVSGLASDDVESVAFLAKEPKFVLVGHAKGKDISVSLDDGKTWTKASMGGDMPRAVVIPISGTNWVVASNAGKGIWWTDDSGKTWKAGEGDVDYFGDALPVCQTGEYLFSSKHHGMIRSSDGGKTWKFDMGPHLRMVGTIGDLVFREGDRQTIPGTKDRILNLEVSADFGVSFGGANNSLLDAVGPDLMKHLIIPAETDPFAHIRIASAWAAAPDNKTALLALGQAGIYKGEMMWTPKGPLLADVSVNPTGVVEGDSKTKIKVKATASAKTGKIAKVFADTSGVGGGELELFDDGQHDDGEAGDKVYANTFTVAKGTKPSAKSIGVIAIDDTGKMSSRAAALLVSSMADRMIVWDGDKFPKGQGWNQPQGGLNFLKTQTDEAHNGKVGLELHGEGAAFIGGGWNWHGWYPANAGTNIRPYANLSFWVKLVGDDPGGVQISLNCSGGEKKPTASVNMAEYMVGDGTDLKDGQWHEVVIPLRDMYKGVGAAFDPASAWEIDINTWAPLKRSFSLYFDEFGFDNRPTRAHGELVTLPEERAPRKISTTAPAVTAEVDLSAEGIAINPYIYGAAMGDRNVGKEAGVPIMRAGGNPASLVNWKKGFSNSGADWYYVNTGTETPPEKNWLVTFHGANKAVGIESYVTFPMMGRVAKDGTSVGYDIKKYPNQTSWAGKVQPTDPHPNAGSGIQYIMGEDGKPKLDAKGNPMTKEVENDPDDCSVVMSPEEQAEMLTFMIKNMKYGTAKEGGVKYIAMDNEPCIWFGTHRPMHPKGTSFDEIVDRTIKYGSLYKAIDPDVKIAGPTWNGFAAYYFSGLDLQECGSGRAKWSEAPDYTAHGKVPISIYYLKKMAEYEKKNGKRLLDIFDFHFYPQTGIYMGGPVNDPKTMEGRVQETRVLWDPDFVDPSWMATAEFGRDMGGKLAIIRLIKKWVDENYPGTQLSLGEYNWGGEGDISGGIAQAELFGIFARERLDQAYLWLYPGANSPHYFAWKLYRNPDCKNTAFGDRYLPSKVDAKDDVSVHAARDTKNGKVTFVLVNKRAAKDAKLTIKLSKAVPAQDVVVYEYSPTDRFAIGQLPVRKVSGNTIEIELPAMSAIRFDVKEK